MNSSKLSKIFFNSDPPSSSNKAPERRLPVVSSVGKDITPFHDDQRQARRMKNAPMNVSGPMRSPKYVAAKAVPHRGSVEKITVVSVEERLFIAKFSP